MGIVSSVSARKLKCPSLAWLGTFIAWLGSSRKIPAWAHHYSILSNSDAKESYLLSTEYGTQLLLQTSQQSLKIWSTKSAKKRHLCASISAHSLHEYNSYLLLLQLREYWKYLEYRLHHRSSKFDRSVFLNLNQFVFFLVLIWLGFLSRN